MNITGINQSIINTIALKNRLSNRMETIAEEILNDIKIRSIHNLDIMSSTPIGNDAIRDVSNWDIKKISNDEYILRCNSRHAAAVEFGSPSQGISGKHYINSTLYELLPTIQEKVSKELKKSL